MPNCSDCSDGLRVSDRVSEPAGSTVVLIGELIAVMHIFYYPLLSPDPKSPFNLDFLINVV